MTSLPSYHPNLTGKVTPATKQAIDYLFENLNKLSGQVTLVKGSVPSSGQIQGHVGPTAQVQLSIAGDSPLNVEGLLGQLSQPQKASATPVNALPGPQDPLSQNGQIILFNHQLYWYDASTDPGTWRHLIQVVIIDTHANRVNYNPIDYIYSFYFESDRQILYVSDGTNWLYVAGEMIGTFSPLTRPTDLGAPDAGFLFHATDAGKTYVWSGTIWSARTEIPTALYDTHQYRTFDATVDVSGGTTLTHNTGPLFSKTWVGKKVMVGGAIRTVATFVSTTSITIDVAVTNGAGQIFNLYEYASVNYPNGTMFFESDRTVYYSVRDIGLTVNVASTTNVTVVGASDRPMDNRWIGANIIINGQAARIFSVTSPTTCTLFAPGVSNGSALVASVPSGIWQYAAGQYAGSLSAIPTGFLNDDYGFLFYAVDFAHAYRWGFSSLGVFEWEFAPGDSGANYIVAGSPNSSALGAWGLCDGTTYSVATPSGSIASVATPDLSGEQFLQGGGGGHKVKTKPTWDAAAKTEDETVHTHTVTVPTDTAPPGVAGSFTFGDAGTYTSSPPSTPNAHALTNTNAIINAPSETDGGLPERVGLSWFLRL